MLILFVEGVPDDHDELPPAVFHSVCDGQPVQWLIVRDPYYVEQGQTSSSVGTIGTNVRASVRTLRGEIRQGILVYIVDRASKRRLFHMDEDRPGWYEAMKENSESLCAVAKTRMVGLGGYPMEFEVVIEGDGVGIVEAHIDEMDYYDSDEMEDDDNDEMMEDSSDEMEEDGSDAMEGFQQLSINESTDHSMGQHGRSYGR